MAYIYKITNNINQKVYIGKTERDIKTRWEEHCSDARHLSDISNRPLYLAMRKYGIDAFNIEQIEETDFPEEREKYWIEYYDSFNNGYNATIGGDGKPYLNYNLIISAYQELQNITKVSEMLNIDKFHLSDILKAKHIDILPSQIVSQKEFGQIVNQYDLNGVYIQSFPSYQAAAKALGKVTKSSRGAVSHISDACKGKRSTAYGFKWDSSESANAAGCKPASFGNN